MTKTARTRTATPSTPARGALTRLLDTLALWTASIGDHNPYLRRGRADNGAARG